MKKLTARSKSDVSLEILLVLNEEEARALDAIVGYGVEPFTKWFYKNCGSWYLKPHEEGMKSLFATVRSELPRHLYKINEARKIISKINPDEMPLPENSNLPKISRWQKFKSSLLSFFKGHEHRYTIPEKIQGYDFLKCDHPGCRMYHDPSLDNIESAQS